MNVNRSNVHHFHTGPSNLPVQSSTLSLQLHLPARAEDPVEESKIQDDG